MITKLSEICDKIGSGATPRGGKEAYCDEGISLVRSQNVLDFEFTDSGLAYINDEQADKLSNVVVQEGDVLLNITGDSVARACMIDTNYLPARVNQHVAIIRGKKNVVRSSYILYFLQANKEYLLQLASAGATRNALTKGMIEQLEIDLPDIEMQDKIVSVLDSLQQKIAENKRINNNLEQQLSSIFHNIFDEEMRDVTLGEVITTTSGGTPSRKKPEFYENAAVCWVKSKELLGGYISDTEEHINDLAINKSAAKILPAESVLIAMYGATVGAYGIISREMACNQAICALLENDRYPHTYLFQYAKEYQSEIVNLAVGSAQQNISQVTIKQLLVHSAIDKIQYFNEIASPVHKQLLQLELENKFLADLRDILLPQLMSGEIDVSDIDL